MDDARRTRGRGGCRPARVCLRSADGSLSAARRTGAVWVAVAASAWASARLGFCGSAIGVLTVSTHGAGDFPRSMHVDGREGERNAASDPERRRRDGQPAVVGLTRLGHEPQPRQAGRDVGDLEASVGVDLDAVVRRVPAEALATWIRMGRRGSTEPSTRRRSLTVLIRSSTRKSGPATRATTGRPRTSARSRTCAGQGVVGLDEGEQLELELEVDRREGGEHPVGEVAGRRVEDLPEATDLERQGVVGEALERALVWLSGVGFIVPLPFVRARGGACRGNGRGSGRCCRWAS